MKGRTFAFLLKFTPAFGAIATVLACSAAINNNGGGGGDAGPAPCDSSKCAVGNKCIANAAGETKCRLTCTEHYGANGCNTGQYCDLSATTPYCVDITKKVTPKPGQWGGACNPTLGEENEGCDGAQGFKCLAELPTDVNSALCTTFDCKTDSECPGQFYCATINAAPNADTSTRSFGETRTACIPRAQCAPCNSNADCKGGRCVADGNNVKSCMRTCDRDSACEKDAYCSEGDTDVPVCYPYAGVCKGDGTLCSPCRSDADCKAGGGVCYDALPNSTERFCTQKVENCSASTCPKPASGVKVGCFKSSEPGVAGQCTGLVTLVKDGELPACWSRKR